MRTSIILLLIALAGVLGGGALIGLPALGGCLIFDSLAVGCWALFRDDGTRPLPVARHDRDALSLPQIFEFEQARQ